MSEAKFTKGDWDIKTTGHYFDGNRRYKHEVLVNSAGITCFERAVANAHLIAAAPEMYEKLEKIHDSMAGNGEYGEFYYDVKELLAKARGEHD